MHRPQRLSFPKTIRRTLSTGFFLILGSLCAFAQTDLPHEPDDSTEQAIISEREEVKIVEDSNVAEAVSRRPDLRFQTVTIDGERTNVALSDLPSDAVRDLEVLRATTPDMDASARGGSLSLKSKPTFNLTEPVRKADLSWEYSAGKNTWLHQGSLTYGQSIGDHFGFRITGAHRNSHDSGENWTVEWQELQKDGTEFIVPSFLFRRYYEHWDIDQNVNATVDYRVTQRLRLQFRGNTTYHWKESYQPNIRYYYESGDYSSIEPNSAQVTDFQIDRDLTAFESRFTRTDLEVGGVFNASPLNVDFRLYRENREYEEPDWFIMQFKNEDADLAYRLDEDFIPVPETSADSRAPDQLEFDPV